MRPYFDGSVEVSIQIAFSGNPQGTFPDGLDVVCSGVGVGGEISGDVTDSSLGSHCTMKGNYDAETMSVEWTDEQHLPGSPNWCSLDATGSGAFSAVLTTI
jgi:hypothetical protein